MATVYTDTGTQVYALQARTNNAGAAVDDVTGEDLRLVAELFTGGVLIDPTDSWQVKQRAAGANMSVDVGSGDADADLAVVPGTAPGQGNYIVRKETGAVNVTVPAANVSNPRLDEVYLVVQDNAYDASARVLPRIAYRDGTPAASPVAPGPDAAWDAYLLLATVSVPAGDTTISDAQITDERAIAGLAGGMSAGSLSDVEVDGSSGISDTTTGSYATMDNAVVLDIPSHWLSWKCFVTAAWDASTPNAGTYQVRFLIDGTAVAESSAIGIAGGVVNQRDSLVGRRTGMVTTGARTIALQALDFTANPVTIFGQIYARAVRTG